MNRKEIEDQLSTSFIKLAQDLRDNKIDTRIFKNEERLLMAAFRQADPKLGTKTVDEIMVMEMSLPYPLNTEWSEIAQALQERSTYEYRAF